MNEAVNQPNESPIFNQAGVANRVVPKKAVYMRSRDMAQFETELETSRLAAENPEAPASVTAHGQEKPNSATDQNQPVNFEKRYTDLQSYSDKKLADLNKQLAEERQKNLKAQEQLKETAQQKPKYPTSEEELARWCQEFPPLLPIIQTIALKAVEGRESALQKQVDELEQFTKVVANEKGRMELLKIHPDANEIEADPRFAHWYNEQEPEIQALIPENGADPKKVAKAITLYKKEFGIVTKTAKDLQKEASYSVNLGPTPPSLPTENKTWTESEVQKLSPKAYAHFEKDIELARHQGRYVYDLTRAS